MWQQLLKEKLHRILQGSLLDRASQHLKKHLEEITMKWETPSFTDLRFGFEVTMYIYNR
jgi:pyrroloquinoline quinone biosynthesis protein A